MPILPHLVGCWLLALSLFAPSARAATDYFFDVNGSALGSGVTGGSFAWGGNFWSTSFEGTSTPGAWVTRSDAIFSAGNDATGSVTVTGATGEMGGVVVQEGNVTITSLTRFYVGGSTVQTLAGTNLTIQNSPDFYNNTITFNAAVGTTITIGGASSGVRNAKIVKSGDGLMVFQGNNTGAAGGTLTVNGGTYRIRDSDALGDGTTTVNSGGSLELANNIAPARAVTIRSGGYNSSGALRSLSGSNTLAGLVTLGANARIHADAGATLTLNPASGDAVTGAFDLTLGGAGTVVVAKPMSVLTSLTKDGASTATLSAASLFTGPTTISAGTLRLVESSGVLGSVAGGVAIHGVLEVTNATAQTLGNVLSGDAGGQLVKLGAGTLTLTAANPFAGTVSVIAGRLALAAGSSLGGSALVSVATGAEFDVSAVSGFSLGSGQTLGGSGTVLGAVNGASGAQLSPGSGSTKGTLTFSNLLTLSGGATCVFDLATTPGGTGDIISVAGNVSLVGANSIRVNYTTLANGTYTLLRTTGGGTISGDVGLLTLLGFIPGSQVATLQTNAANTEVQLVISANPHAALNLTWTGDGTTNVWDEGSTITWRNGAVPTVFLAPDNVTFDSVGAANATVALVGVLGPGSVSVSVNAATNYTFTGSGSLSGAMTLAKSGAGRLTISNANAFTGATTISGGALNVTTGSALGSGAVVNNGTLEFSPSSTMTFSNVISGSGAVQQVSSATTVLAGSNTFSGGLSVIAGKVTLGHASALGSTAGGTTINEGATLDLAGYAISAEPLALNGGTLANSSGTAASFAGPVALSGTNASIAATGAITLSGGMSGSAPFTKSGAGTLTLSGASSHSGTLTVSAGTLLVTGSTGTGPVVIEPSATLGGNGNIGGAVTMSGTLSLGGSIGTLTVNGLLTLQPGSKSSFRLSKSGGVTSSDRVSGMSAVTLGGALSVSLSGQPVSDGDVFQLFSAGAYTGAFASLNLPWLYNDLQWDTAQLSINGTLRVVKIPAVSTLAQRRAWALTEAGENPSAASGFIRAAAYFARGDTSLGQSAALSASVALVDSFVNSPEQVDLFDMWPAMDTYIRFNALLDAATKANIQQVITSFTQYADTNTSNLKKLGHVTRFLGSEAFGEAAFVPGSEWRTNDPNARANLLSLMTTEAGSGYPEHASRPYYWFNLLPMLSLAQLAQDPTIRSRAQLAFEAGLAQCAGTWMRGHLGVATPRSYPDMETQSASSSMSLLWHYFGGDVLPGSFAPAVFAAVMNYTPSSPIIEIAGSDRSAPMTTRSLINSAQQTSFLDGDYVLFSDGPRSVGNFQVYGNGVMWSDPSSSRYSFLWLAAPFTNDPAVIYSSHPHGRNSSYYKEGQHGDTVAYVFAPGGAWPFALCYVPGGYAASFNDSASGRVFLHYGTVMIAIRSEIPFTWDPNSGIAAPCAPPKAGDSEFQVGTSGAQFAMAIETARPALYAGATAADQLAAFRADILASTAISHTAGSPPTAHYTNRHGDTIDVTLSSNSATLPVTVNDLALNQDNWPVIENPWMKQRNDRLLTLFSAQRRDLYDFNQWTKSVHTAPLLAPPASAINVTATGLDIDLYPFVSDAESADSALLLETSAATGGTVTLLSDGHTARFTPTAGFSGAAVFTVLASDNSPAPHRLTFYYDYEPTDSLADNLVTDRSGHARDATLAKLGTGTAALGSNVPSALAGSTQSLATTESGSANGVCLRRTLSTGDIALHRSAWTFSTWLRRDTRTTDDFIFFLGADNGFGDGSDIIQLYASANTDQVRLLHLDAANLTTHNVATPATFTSGVWHHVALTHEPTATGVGTFRVYLDGILGATVSGVTWTAHQSSPLCIAGHNGTSNVDRFFSGTLDEAVLFEESLDTTAIARLGRISPAYFVGLSATGSVALTVLTNLESWRQTNFGTTANAGSAADLADNDGDGTANLIEYATAMNPAVNDVVPQSATKSGNTLEFIYTKNKAATEVTYTVEWSDDLVAWSAVGVTSSVLTDGPTTQQIKALVPAGVARRFVHLKVTRP